MAVTPPQKRRLGRLWVAELGVPVLDDTNHWLLRIRFVWGRENRCPSPKRRTDPGARKAWSEFRSRNLDLSIRVSPSLLPGLHRTARGRRFARRPSTLRRSISATGAPLQGKDGRRVPLPALVVEGPSQISHLVRLSRISSPCRVCSEGLATERLPSPLRSRYQISPNTSVAVSS